MLSYVDSLNRKRDSSRLMLVCMTISCVIHFCVFMLFFLFPELLAGGYFRHFRGVHWMVADRDDEDMKEWRTVAILEPPRRMKLPSSEILRESLGLGDKETGEGTSSGAVRIGHHDDALETDDAQMTRISFEIEESEVVVPDVTPPGAEDGVEYDTGSFTKPSETEFADPGIGRDVIAAKPEPTPDVTQVTEVTPIAIPETITPPSQPTQSSPNPAFSPSTRPPDVKTVATASARESGIEFLNSEGFPMDAYRDILSERIKAKWFFPSNLKNTFGKTAVTFYIDRNGRVSGLRVDATSGHSSLDIAALTAVMDAAPFPPLPTGFPGERVSVRIFLSVERE